MIRIDEQGKAAKAPRQGESGIDLQDCLLLAGIISGEAAAIVIWWPSSLILAALFAFGFAYLIEKAKKAKR